MDDSQNQKGRTKEQLVHFYITLNIPLCHCYVQSSLFVSLAYFVCWRQKYKTIYISLRKQQIFCTFHVQIVLAYVHTDCVSHCSVWQKWKERLTILIGLLMIIPGIIQPYFVIFYKEWMHNKGDVLWWGWEELKGQCCFGGRTNRWMDRWIDAWMDGGGGSGGKRGYGGLM